VTTRARVLRNRERTDLVKVNKAFNQWGVVPKLGLPLEIRLLTRDDWVELRNIRLAALQESPDAFLSTYQQEVVYDSDRWRTEFDRGNWYVGIRAGAPVSLLGVTRGTGTPIHECYLEYLWVAPEHRRSGIASGMLTAILERLRTAAVGTTFVWVIDGNEAARHLYERIGFVSSSYRQPLTARPGRSEEKLILPLA
jgi:ribosomal protein S18 acetylase RimI-like enzyme